ncbi:MAG: 3-deoxy-7-phosphoheptulonate synthase [Polyangiaceae bacterium]|nr:3-deoxy-7-phosphoheptulonate synthase [Polyangiaceae bacterium]MCE7891002.1 3-deoxy-7-phosphoheptulonate synthase [Sorangiineae bacterium PRO1]MCL4750330.1 3-deoxy-7-phosphoheptulonate synthase [Myxococcales bacterium]
MLIVMSSNATPDQVRGVCDRIRELGFTPNEIPGAVRVAIGITGNKGAVDPALFNRLPGVQEAVAVSKPWKLVSREVKPDDTVIDVGGVKIGGGALVVMAGPCSVESREQVLSTARHVREQGARILRGGAFKPRTSPYDFQGLREEGLALLAEARRATGMPVITEVKDTETLKVVAEHADILQIGARNMQNFSLLEAVGALGKPVMLKRGIASTVNEWLMAAEYIVSRGNYQVMLCERGIRTYETLTRNTLDLGVLPLLRAITHLPIVVDPSHGTGVAKAVAPMARAAAATGVDGVIVEVHPNPSKALSDGPQALTFDMFTEMMSDVRKVAAALGQPLG